MLKCEITYRIHRVINGFLHCETSNPQALQQEHASSPGMATVLVRTVRHQRKSSHWYELSSLQKLQTQCCLRKSLRIMKRPTHLCSLSSMRFYSLRFFPQAIRLDKQHTHRPKHKHTAHTHNPTIRDIFDNSCISRTLPSSLLHL